MHSAIQTELRLTRKIVRSTCHHCAERCQSPKRSFHNGRRSRAAQGANDGSPSTTPTTSKDNAVNADGQPEIAQDSLRFFNESSALEREQSKSTGGPPPQGADNAPLTNFYGSSAKRRLRARMWKETENTQAVPDWFSKHNVVLYGQEQLSPGTPSKIQNYRPNLDDLRDRFPHIIIPNESEPQAEPKEKLDSSAMDPSQARLARSDVDDDYLYGRSRMFKSDDPRYYLDERQVLEIERTVRGLLVPGPTQEPQYDLADSKAHLQLHFAGKDGDLLLRAVVEGLARHYETNYLVLDAHDIGELVSGSNVRLETATDGRMLSYEVYNDVFGPAPDPMVNMPSSFGDESITLEAEEDADGQDENDMPSGPTSMGMPVIFGKPITIDLKSAFGPRRGGMRPDSMFGPNKLLSNMFRDDGQKSTGQSHLFSAIIESLLESVAQKKASQRDAAQSMSARTIVHVENFKAIKDVAVGKQFLLELYDQVEKRRSRGERILVIGTDCVKRNESEISNSPVDEMQPGIADDLSRSIVLTPVVPRTLAKFAFLQDRKQRTATVNARHLWKMMRNYDHPLWSKVEAGFWRGDFLRKLNSQDRRILESQIWKFSYVHRVATYITGGMRKVAMADPSVPNKQIENTGATFEEAASLIPQIKYAVEELKWSDQSKSNWLERQKSAKKEVTMRLEPPEEARLAKIRSSLNKYEKKLLSGVIEPKNISTTFNDIHVPAETIDALQTLTTLSLVRPEAFKYGVLATDKIPGLLLYGPPGTGKTLLAKAVAKESGATVLEVSGADINDMYVGEGEKNVKALFSLARKLSPCVVFLDEADAMFSARSSQGRRVSHRELLNQFLKEWDGMSNDAGSAFIMVATNRPSDLDDAVLRRLPRRLLVDLPTEDDRTQILKIHLRNEDLAEDVNLGQIASKTPFYSGSDLKNLAVAAALSAVREENELAKHHKGEKPYNYPERRTLTGKHFETALDEISASISEDMASLRAIKKFDEQFGDKKGRKRKSPKWGFRTAAEADQALDTVKVRS